MTSHFDARKQYQLGDALAAINAGRSKDAQLSSVQVNTWVRLGHLKRLAKQEAPGSGGRRTYRLRDIVDIAAMHAMTSIGVQHSVAADCLQYIERALAERLHVGPDVAQQHGVARIYIHRETATGKFIADYGRDEPNDDVLKEMFMAMPACIAVNLDVIINSVLRELEDV